MTDEDIRNLWRSSNDVLLFARAIEAKVREECAVICDERAKVWDSWRVTNLVAGKKSHESRQCAEAIRAGGKDE